MCKNEKRCGVWISLECMGINGSGCLRNKEWVKQIQIPCHHLISQKNIYINLPNKKLIYNGTVARGSFGCIDIANYETKDEIKEVYIKRPIHPGKNLFYEACIQKIVGESLSLIGFPTATPKIIDIFKLYDGSVCFSMEPVQGAMTLDKYLNLISSSQFSKTIIDCLLQLLSMNWHLNSVLGINHRDLKPSNFLIVPHQTSFTKILSIHNEIIEISSNYTLTMIDFGFACIGSTETQISDLSLSSVYPVNDPCPKDGRDLYLFLSLLYMDYHTKLSGTLKTLFESWLEVPENDTDICSFIRKNHKKSELWLYFLAGNENIKKFKSCPLRILHDLQALIS
jgi:serine/threonine protein kinase